MSKPRFFDLLPFQVVQLLIKFCKSLPERYRALLEYWEERRKEKIEDVDDEYDDAEEGMHNSIGESLLTSLFTFLLISIRLA